MGDGRPDGRSLECDGECRGNGLRLSETGVDLGEDAFESGALILLGGELSHDEAWLSVGLALPVVDTGLGVFSTGGTVLVGRGRGRANSKSSSQFSAVFRLDALDPPGRDEEAVDGRDMVAASFDCRTGGCVGVLALSSIKVWWKRDQRGTIDGLGF